jgi:hypothetical protein
MKMINAIGSNYPSNQYLFSFEKRIERKHTFCIRSLGVPLSVIVPAIDTKLVVIWL